MLEGIRGACLFYGVLSFRNDLQRLPDAFVIPSAVVADALYQAHRAWLARPGRGGVPHNDGDIRRFLPDYSREGLEQEFGLGWLEQYRESWHGLAPKKSGRRAGPKRRRSEERRRGKGGGSM